MKSIISNELRTTTPTSAITPTIETAEKLTLKIQCAGNTPINASGITIIVNNGKLNDR